MGCLNDFNPISSATFGSPWYGVGKLTGNNSTNILSNPSSGNSSSTNSSGLDYMNGVMVDPKAVGQDSLAIQLALAPQVYAANALYQPQYAQLQNQILNQTVTGQGGLMDLYKSVAPQLSTLDATANTAQRSADIADVTNLGKSATDAYLSANPDLAAARTSLSSTVNGLPGTASTLSNFYNAPTGAPTANTFSGTPLGNQLATQASDQLALNGQLSTMDQRNAAQTARAAYAARGLGDSNQAIGAEVLNTQDLVNQRRTQAQQLAAGVQSQQQTAGLANAGMLNSMASQIYGQQNQNAQFGAQLQTGTQLNQAQLNQQALQTQLGAKYNLASLYGSQAQDPFQMVLGRSGVPAQTQSAVSQGAYTQGASPTMFNPFSSDITSIYAGNAANTTALNVASKNSSSAQSSAGIGAAGSVAAAALPYILSMFCWGARAAFGAGSPRWRVARRWMLRSAPRRLYEAYAACGEALGRAIAAAGAAEQARWRGIYRRLVAGDVGAQRELAAALALQPSTC